MLSLTKKLSLIPILGLLSCLYLMTELGVSNWTRFAVWLLFGFAIYFGYSYDRSRLSPDPDGPKRRDPALAIGAVGFLVAGLGLGITAFSFIADLIVHVFPSLSRQTVTTVEVALFVIGAAVGIAGVVIGTRRKE